jgi:hypothetical protein
MKGSGTVDIIDKKEDSESSSSGSNIRVRRYAPIISAAACFVAVIGISGAIIALRGPKKSNPDSHTSSAVSSSSAAPMAEESSNSELIGEDSSDPESIAESREETQSTSDSKPSESESKKEADTSADDTQIITEITTDEEVDDEGENDDKKTEDSKTDDNKESDKKLDDNKQSDEHRTGDLPDEHIDEIEAASKVLLENLKSIDLITVSVIDTDTTVLYDEDFNETSYADVAYVRVTDSRFSSISDIKAYIGANMTGDAQSYYNKCTDRVFKEHDGKLYLVVDYTGESVYADADENSMTLSHITETSFTFEAPFSTRGGSLFGRISASCVLDNGTWKIDSVKAVYDDAIVD